MKLSFSVAAAPALLGGLVALSFATADAPPPPAPQPELTQQQSPRRPAPGWLKIIDQGTNDPRLKGYLTPEGLKVEIVAEGPTVVNPVGMTFADDGTAYVLEWRPSPGDEWKETPETFTYKDGTTRKVATMKKRVKDVVKVLRDTKKKDVYDKSEVILEDELPSSILLHDGWVYLASRGSVRRFKQTKPGGPYDVKEVIAKGFCGFHHHQVSGMTVGNDGWLYVTSGDDDNYVEGSDGSRATVLRTGAVFRMRPDGSKVHTYALGFRNPYRDVAFDTSFNMFHADNDNEDGSKFTGCRLMHVAEGADFGWRLRVGARCCSPDSARGAVHGELPGKVPSMLKTGRGSPAGLLIYNDTRFPERYRGLLLYPDVFRKLIRAYQVEPRGASFAVTHEFEFMKSNDPLFRPCQMVLGPDGAMYVVDWRTDSGGAGKLWGDGKHGRIYRITWAGTKDEPALPPRPMDSWAGFAKMSDAELLKTLASDEASFRARAQRELVKRGEKNRPALLKLLADADAPLPAQVAALGALQSFWNADVQKAFARLVVEGDPDLRRLAAEGLGLNAPHGDKDAQEALLQALSTDDPAVKRAVALAMGRVAGPGAADALVNALAFDSGRDPYLLDGLVRAVERLGKPGMDRLLAQAESGVAKDTQRVVTAFAMMRTRPAYEALPAVLRYPHLSVAERAALIRSYNNYLLDPPVSVQPVLDYLKAHPREPAAVRLAALEVLSTPGHQKNDKIGDWLLTQLDDADPKLRLAAIKAVEGTRLTRAAPALAQLLGDGTRPAAEQEAAVKALRLLNNRDAVAPLAKIVAAKATTPQAQALRREAFRTLAVLDPKAALAGAKEFLNHSDPALRREAVTVLGTDVEGTRLVARLFLDKKLPHDLLPLVSDALRKHVGRDPELAKTLSAVMKQGLLIANTPEEQARLRALVRSKGNAQRGRALYLNGATLACITCHRLEGVGGNVGPDLTRLWDTLSVEKIMESIIEPSKEIKEGYQAYRAVTAKGQVFTGLKVSQTADEVVLRDATAKDVRIATRDLEELTPSKVSLMPDNVVSQLTYDQFIDLVAFLKDRPAQESLRGLALDFHVVGPFAGGIKEAGPPEKKAEPLATYPGVKPGQVLKWGPAQAGPTGLLDLHAVAPGAGDSAYALTYVYSPKGQKAEMLLGSGGPVRVWVDGKQVHENVSPRQARPDQDRVPVALKQGWNAVLAKVAGGRPGLYLRFAGDGLHVARSPREVK